ncbi:MAG: hypothetical protein AB7F78_26715, partial [Hyphomicrobiaceae bacterium]
MRSASDQLEDDVQLHVDSNDRDPGQHRADTGRRIVARDIVKEFDTEIGVRRVLDGVSFSVG